MQKQIKISLKKSNHSRKKTDKIKRILHISKKDKMNPMIKMAYQKYVFVNNQFLDICLKYFFKIPYTTQICRDQSCLIQSNCLLCP